MTAHDRPIGYGIDFGTSNSSVSIAYGDRVEVLAVNRLGEPVDASPAVAGKQLFLRGEKHLWCFEDPQAVA